MTLERNVNLSKMNNDTWQEAIWLAHRTEAWLLVDFHSISAIFQVNTFLSENGDILASFFSLSGTEGWKKNPDISQIQIQPHVGFFMKNL